MQKILIKQVDKHLSTASPEPYRSQAQSDLPSHSDTMALPLHISSKSPGNCGRSVTESRVSQISRRHWIKGPLGRPSTQRVPRHTFVRAIVVAEGNSGPIHPRQPWIKTCRARIKQTTRTFHPSERLERRRRLCTGCSGGECRCNALLMVRVCQHCKVE